jgi:hypothetical protein
MSFYWPRSLKVLEESGAWSRIAGRFANIGGSEASAEAEVAWRELLALERLEISEAIRGGAQYQTIWEKQNA